MPDIKAIKLAEEMIKVTVSTLDDLPRELANTTANIFYKSALIDIEAMRRKDNPFALPQQVLTEKKGMTEGYKNFTEHLATVMSDQKAVIESIKCLRGVDKIKEPRMYSYMVDFCLDNLKDNIRNAHMKPGIIRMMERPFKKVDEIEGLVDLMRFD